MESFIYANLNKACRLKDSSKIQYFGAYAAALSCIIYFANNNKKGQNSQCDITLFRGLKMHPLDADSYLENTIINLVGYTSTSKLFSKAFKFAIFDVKDDQVPVVF